MFGQRVLVVGAHPDDIEMGAGGTMHKLWVEGRPAHTLTLCSCGDRWKESAAAQLRLGVPIANREFWAYADTRVDDMKAAVIAQLDDLIKAMKPDTVITHYWGDTHQDHRACYEIVVAAARNVPNLLMFNPTYPSGRCDAPFHPTLISKLSEASMAAKMEAMAEFKSQVGKYGEERWSESLKASAAGDAWRYGGFHGYVELFQVSRVIA